MTTEVHEGRANNSALDNFVNAIRSPATRQVYVNSFRRYMKHLKITDADSLLLQAVSPKVIEAQLIDYVMSLRQDGIAYATIQHLIAPVFTFYQLNDVIVNRKKVQRYLGEYKRVAKDKAYSIEQIQQALQTADSRMRMIILLLASTGCRIGALPGLTLSNLTKIEYSIYKLTFYEGTNNEYYSFCTRECAQTGIDNYLLYRQRCGAVIQSLQSDIDLHLGTSKNITELMYKKLGITKERDVAS